MNAAHAAQPGAEPMPLDGLVPLHKTLSIIDGLLDYYAIEDRWCRTSRDDHDGRCLAAGAMRLVLQTHGIRGLRLRAFIRRVQRKAINPERRLDVIRAFLLATRQIVIEGIDGNRDAPISLPCHPGQLMLPFENVTQTPKASA